MNTDRASDQNERIVGVDVGTRRVGLAVSDPLGTFAQPVGAYTPNEAVRILAQLYRDKNVRTAVVGWPVTEDGRDGPAAAMVNTFVRRIRKAMAGVKVVRWPEDYTTEEARSRLGPVPRSERGRIDTMVAGILLQEFLESRDGA